MWAGLDCFQNVQAPEMAKNVVTMSASISFIPIKLITTLEIFLKVMKIAVNLGISQYGLKNCFGHVA